MNSDSIARVITMLVAVVCAGCREEAGRESEHVASNNVDPRGAVVETEKDKGRQVPNVGEIRRELGHIASDNVEPRIAAIEAEIGKCRQMLDVGGWNAAIWSSSVAKSILALDDAGQQKRLVDAYLAHLAALDPLTDTHKAISTSLFNYSMMLDAYLLLYKFPDAEEKLFGLMCRCIRLYRAEINNLTVEVEGKPASRRRLDLKHERMCMTGDLKDYSNYVERTYFPWALSHGMPKARYDHWRNTFLDAFADPNALSVDGQESTGKGR